MRITNYQEGAGVFLHRLFIKAYDRIAVDFYPSLERNPGQSLYDFVQEKSGTWTSFLLTQQIFEQQPAREEKVPFVTRMLYTGKEPLYTGVNYAWAEGDIFELNLLNVTEEKCFSILQSSVKDLSVLSVDHFVYKEEVQHRKAFDITIKLSKELSVTK